MLHKSMEVAVAYDCHNWKSGVSKFPFYHINIHFMSMLAALKTLVPASGSEDPYVVYQRHLRFLR